MDPQVLVVDLRSDTVTKPTAVMRKAIMEAEVGDDVYREDPTVIKLEETVAAMMGKEAALFFPTGTMANLASIMSHCWERGREVLVGDRSHIYLFEQGGSAQLAGVQLRALKTNEDATFDLAEIEEKINMRPDIHGCITGLLCLENTHNRCGGLVLSTDYITKVCSIAKQHNVPVHMDGARITNAAVHLGLPVATIVKDCDSVSMCLSKSLGAPVGSVVAGSEQFVKKLLRCRKVLGGAMRQVGVLAAAGIVGLQSYEERLLRDHSNAYRLATAVSEINSSLVGVNLPRTQTNMVILHFPKKQLTAERFVSRMKEFNPQERLRVGRDAVVKIHLWCSTQTRCVFHSDVSEEDSNTVIKKVQYVIEELSVNGTT